MSEQDTQFGVVWPQPNIPLIQKHMYCAYHNVGNGRYFHRKAIIQGLWPGELYRWNRWDDRALRGLCDYNFVTWAGPGGSAKTTRAAVMGLEYWLELPSETAVIVCSTTMKMLRKRAWAQIAHYHGQLNRLGKAGSFGELIDSDTLVRWKKGDNKHGIFGMAVEEGSVDEVINNLIGIHARRIMLIVDEMQGVREAIMEATRNMSKNPEFRFLGIGNPESMQDQLGKYSEPINGWNSVTLGETEEWETKGGPGKGRGLCQCFDGRRSPADDSPEEAKRLYFLIRKEWVDAHLESVNGNDQDPSFLSQAVGIWPKMGLDDTVLNDAIVNKFKCREPAVWTNGFFKWASLDPAFGGADTASLTFGKCGEVSDADGTRWVIEEKEQVAVPIIAESSDPVHYQIVHFVKRECEKRGIGPTDFGLDSSGEGGGLMSIFEVLWGAVQGVEFGGKPSNSIVSNGKTAAEVYDRRASELNLMVREFAQSNGIRGLNDKVVSQFCARKTLYRGGKLRVEPKTVPKGGGSLGFSVGYKQRLGKSPDESESFAIGVEVCRRKGATAFSGAANPKVAEDWNAEVQKIGDLYDESAYLESAV